MSAGGGTGSCNYFEVRRPSGEVERYAFATGVKLNKGDVVRIVTGNGGGFGDPHLRSKDALRADLHAGYLTPLEVEQVYGGLQPAASGRPRAFANHLTKAYP